MRYRLLSAFLGLTFASAGLAQEIVEVPAGKANVARPDDLFSLPPGQWYMAKSIALGSEPCQPDQCEAGFTRGDLVVSVEHAKDYVLIIAGFRQCERTAYTEIEVGTKPGKSAFKRVSKDMQKVVKGLAKTCNLTAPHVEELDASQLFPKAAP